MAVLFLLASPKKSKSLKIMFNSLRDTSLTVERSLASQHAAGGFYLHFYDKTP